MSEQFEIDKNGNGSWVKSKARYRLETIGNKSKLIDLETGEDMGKIVESVSVFVDYEGVQATVKLAHGQLDCAIDIPVDVRTKESVADRIKFRLEQFTKELEQIAAQ